MIIITVFFLSSSDPVINGENLTTLAFSSVTVFLNVCRSLIFNTEHAVCCPSETCNILDLLIMTVNLYMPKHYF